MKQTTALVLLLMLLSSFHLAQANPTISTQPLSRTNNVGDNAQFTVTATGSGTLSYQWKYNAVNLTDATNATLNVAIADASKAGTYSVVVTDANGPTPSSGAVLSLPFADRVKFTQWDFNSATPDDNPNTGRTTPSIGAGTLAAIGSNVGATSAGYTAGSPSDPAPSDNSRRAYTGLQNGKTADKTGGSRFTVSTAGYTNIAVSGELFVSAVGAAYWVGQYTLDGTTWVDHLQIDRRSAFVAGYSGLVWFADDLSDVTGAANNPNFAYRVVAAFESTATGSGNAAYVACDPGQAYNNANGLFGWDMVTFLGKVIVSEPAITTQPKDQDTVLGANAAFSVVATGGNLGYQWLFNDGLIPNATNSTLLVTNVQYANAGNYSVIVSNSVGSITSSYAVLTVEAVIPAGSRYWSGDGLSLGGAGTWDTSSAQWGPSDTPPFNLAWNNANQDSAVFNAPAGTVTIGEAITVSNLTVVGDANYTFSGSGRLTFAPDAQFNCTSTKNNAAVSLTCPLGGDVLHKSGAGRLHLNNTGNNINKFVATAGVISVQNGSSLGTTPAEVVPDRITLDGAGLGFEGTSPNLSATRGLTLGAGGGKLGTRSGNVTLTIHAPITGLGGISFPPYNGFHGSGVYGANVRFIFDNPANNYQGSTTVTVGELRLGAAEVLPDTTTLILNGSSAAGQQGRLDLAGYTETVGNVIVNGSGAAIYDTVGGGHLIATNYDLRTSRTSSGTNSLNSLNAVLAGNANLTKTTTGDVELSGANTYTGETFLTAGNTILTSPGQFGAGALHLDGGNLVLNDTRTEATILLSPVVVTNPVEAQIQSSMTATGEVVFLSGGTWTVEQGILYLFNGSADPASSFTLALTNAAHFSAPAEVVTWTASCRLSALNPEGTEQIFDSVISGSGSFRRSVLSGTGGRTIFTAQNNYGGGTVIEAGTLVVNNPSGSGTGSGAVSVGAPGGVLAGNGSVSGAVTVTAGGSISAGDPVGLLTLRAGLDASAGGANIWDLAALKDNNTGVAGTDFDQLVLTGGELVLGGSSQVVLQFGAGLAPTSVNPFWQAAHTWTLVSLSGGQNTAHAAFASVVNGSFNAGTFATSVDGSGNILLTFTPAVPSAPHVTLHPQSRTNVVGTTATFTVAATGSDPLTYAWYQSSAPFTAIPGATNATLTLSNVQASQADGYFARVSNGLGNDTSQVATLTVAPRPQMQAPVGAGTGSVVLTWPTVPNTAYQVQYNTNLATANWYVLTNVTASEASLSITDHPPVNSPQRFYRLFVQ